MPGFSIAAAGGKGVSSNVKPFYSYTWEIVNLFGTAITPIAGGSSGSSSIPIFAETLTLPTFSAAREEVPGASLKYKIAGEISWEDCKVTFYDTVGLCAVLKKWREAIWKPETGLAVESDYKANSILKVYTADWLVSKDWTLFGSWPCEIKEGDLTYADSNFKIVSVTLSYDWAVDNCDPGAPSGSAQTPPNSSQNTPSGGGGGGGGGNGGGGGGGGNGGGNPPTADQSTLLNMAGFSSGVSVIGSTAFQDGGRIGDFGDGNTTFRTVGPPSEIFSL